MIAISQTAKENKKKNINKEKRKKKMKDLFFFTFHPRRDHWWVPSIPPWSLASQSRPSWWSTGHPWAWQRSLWGDEHIPKLPWCHGWSRARRSPAGDHPCQSPPCWLGISLRRWFGCTQRLRECLPSGFEEGSTYKGLCMRRTKQLVGLRGEDEAHHPIVVKKSRKGKKKKKRKKQKQERERMNSGC